MNIICGINPVLEALTAVARHFDRLLIVKGMRNRRVSEAIARASQLGIPLRFEPREALDRLAGGVPHQGLIAIVSAKPVMTLEALLDEAREPALFVVLDGIEDPRNLGAIVRTAEAAGVDGVLLPERRSAGLSETVSRASAGGLEHVKLARIGNVVQAIETLKQRGVWIVGFDAEGRERWDVVDYRRPVAIVLGGEGRGMRRLVRERCDHVASLPLFGHVDSLNVSVTAGVALYEVIRQRGAVPSHVRPIAVRPMLEEPVRILAAPTGEETGSAQLSEAHLLQEGGEPEEPEEADDASFEDWPEEAEWAGPPQQFRGGPPEHGRGRNRIGAPGRSGESFRSHRRRRRGSARSSSPSAGPPTPANTPSPGPALGTKGSAPGPSGRRRRRRRRR